MLTPVKRGGGAGLRSCLLSHQSTSCLPCRSAAVAGVRETEAGAQCRLCIAPHSLHFCGNKPQGNAETSLGREMASCLLHPPHTPIPFSIPCFSCRGPPTSPPPASESSQPAWDLPAKNKPGWGWEGGSKIPSVASLSPTAWLLGVLDHRRGDAYPHCASVSPPRGNYLLG